MMNRRTLLKTSLGAGLLAAAPTSSGFSAPGFKQLIDDMRKRAGAMSAMFYSGCEVECAARIVPGDLPDDCVKALALEGIGTGVV